MRSIRPLTKPGIVLAASALGLSGLLVGPIGTTTAGAQSQPGTGATGPVTTKFTYTGHPETFTVPAGVTKLTIIAAGGKGGQGDGGVPGGAGIAVYGTDLSVQPGQSLQVIVGGNGHAGAGPKAYDAGHGGYNGGGDGHHRSGGGGGGGFSSVREAKTGSLLVVAGGGGGGGANGLKGGGRGAPYGAGLNGENGTSGLSTAGGGGGGGLNAGGAGGHNSSPFIPDGHGGGAFSGGESGPGVIPGKGGGGGGGGGYFGGGGGAGGETGGAGGGAGSSYVIPNAQIATYPNPGSPDVSIIYYDAKVERPTMQCPHALSVKPGQTLTDLHICTSDGKPLPDVSVKDGSLPDGVTYKRWPSPADSWIVLNGTAPTKSGRYSWVFRASNSSGSDETRTGLEVTGPSETTTPSTTTSTTVPDTTPGTTPGSTPATTQPAPSPPTTQPKPAPPTTQPNIRPTARCDVTVTNLTGADHPVTLQSAGKGSGDRWSPAPPQGKAIPQSQQVHWMSEDPPPGGCHTEARLVLPRDGAPEVVWTISVTLRGDQPAVSCNSSDQAFPCVVGPDEKPYDGQLTVPIELRHG